MRHNSHCERLLRVWYAYNGLRWTPQVITTSQLRGEMDMFLPWEEIAASFRCVARHFLPEETWIPRMIRPYALDDVVDFWQEIPEMAGRLAINPDGLMAFFCLLADPPRYGTSIGRYPGQLAKVKDMTCQAPRLLDIGCGVGLGTLEAASFLHASTVCGITSEPLEVWMAEQRSLPHDAQRGRLFENYRGIQAVFQIGNASHFESAGQYDLVLCNGLAGGRFLNAPDDIKSFLAGCRRTLAANGVLAMANAFHEGRRRDVDTLLDFASDSGWRVTGNWRDAYLVRGV